jgi:hypothetical protein
MTLQQSMENVVDTGTLWKLEQIDNLADAFQNTERSCIAGTELPFSVRFKGLGRPVEQAEPDPVTNRKLHVPV